MIFDLMDVLVILAFHFLGDFVLQSHRMAVNKSKHSGWLAAHCAVYTVTLMALGITWALVNGVLHFMVDFVTSRITSRLWQKGQIHYFFVVIGLDQLIHYVCLFGTREWFS